MLRSAPIREIGTVDDLLATAFQQHYRRIYDYVRRSGSSHADAEEITQEVFAQAAARLHRLSTDARPLAPWLYTVTKRRLADEARRRGRTCGMPARAS
jgi:RNA polymerase sigma-70 factor, ECF subfamily